jgi:hypothetical protein
MTNVALDPIVATLASTLHQVGNDVVVPDDAVAKCRAQLRAAGPSQKERLARDLIAWALKLQRIGGNHALQPRIAAAELALELLGDETAARDMFGKAGLEKDMSAALGGRSTPTRAPAVDASKPTTAGAPVKPKRGLR